MSVDIAKSAAAAPGAVQVPAAEEVFEMAPPREDEKPELPPMSPVPPMAQPRAEAVPVQVQAPAPAPVQAPVPVPAPVAAPVPAPVSAPVPVPAPTSLPTATLVSPPPPPPPSNNAAIPAISPELSQKLESKMSSDYGLPGNRQRLRVQLTWKNIMVWPNLNVGCVKKPAAQPGETKRLILRNVSGTVRPGQFLSIIGSTGAGKTTLLQLLSGKMFPHNLEYTGTIEINGQPRDNIDYSRFTAFVQQDDVLMENLTVRECMQFSANVKSPGTLKQRTERVNDLMEELELNECGDLRFGGDVIRKGEKKRASIGVELITNPALLYVDEPTTGMDCFTAMKIVQIMRKLAMRGRTIIATIHQPNSQIFAQFDQLMILSLGRIVYFSSAKNAVAHFDRLGYTCPPNKNPAEHFMKILSADNFMKADDVGDVLEVAKKRYEEAVIKMHDFYESPENLYKCKVDQVSDNVTAITASKLSEIKYVAPWAKQFMYLCYRSFINTLRSPEATVMRFIHTAIVYVLGIALYYDVGNAGYSSMQGVIGKQFYVLTFCFMNAIQNVVLVFPEERAVFLREQASSLYDISAYFLGKVLAEAPFDLLIPLMGLLIVYWSFDMTNVHGYNFWLNLLNFELMYFTGCGYGLIIGAAVADRNMLMTILPMVLLPIMLVCGFFTKVTSSDHILWIIHFISPLKYSFNIGARVFRSIFMSIRMSLRTRRSR